MHITLVNPSQVYRASQVAASSVPPLGLAYLVAVTERAGHRVTVVDALGDALDRDFPYRGYRVRGLTPDEIVDAIPSHSDLVGFSNMFSFAYPLVRDTIACLKRRHPGQQVALGGVSVTGIPRFVMETSLTDFAVTGEAEGPFVALLDALGADRAPHDVPGVWFRDAGEIRHGHSAAPLVECIDDLPMPAYERFPTEAYIQTQDPQGVARGRWLPIIATRGCPYTCRFCTAPTMWRADFRVRSALGICDEIDHWRSRFGVTDFHFEDLTIALNARWLDQLCDEMVRRRLGITWQIPNGTRAESVDPALLRKMVASGCTNITFAPETGSQRVLDSMNKRMRLEDIERATELAVAAGLSTCCFFFLGFPGETRADVRATFAFQRRLARIGLDEVATATFTPLPTSEMFDRMLASGEITLTDEFLVSLSLMGDLGGARSWNPCFSDRALHWLRRFSYLQFFVASWWHHPSKALRTLRNLWTGEQETKAERVASKLLRRVLPLRKRMLPFVPLPEVR